MKALEILKQTMAEDIEETGGLLTTRSRISFLTKRIEKTQEAISELEEPKFCPTCQFDNRCSIQDSMQTQAGQDFKTFGCVRHELREQL